MLWIKWSKNWNWLSLSRRSGRKLIKHTKSMFTKTNNLNWRTDLSLAQLNPIMSTLSCNIFEPNQQIIFYCLPWIAHSQIENTMMKMEIMIVIVKKIKTANTVVRKQDSFKIGRMLVSFFPNCKISAGSLHWYSETGVDLALAQLHTEWRLGVLERLELTLTDRVSIIGVRR